MLKVHGNDGKVHEGELFAVDPISKALVLKIDGSYSIFNPSQISRIEGDLSQANPPSLGDLGISIASIEKREATALKAAEKAIAAINNDVGSDVQTLFDRLSIVYPCTWERNSIIILDEYVIDPPYVSISVKSGRDGSEIERFRKILERERKKLNLDDSPQI